MTQPAQITLDQWEQHYRQLCREGLSEPFFGGPLSRHVKDGDTRLLHLRFDNSPAALALWNLLLSENHRLRQYKADGKILIAAMKDLGTIPVMTAGLEQVVTFYPDGTWWTPCVMEQNEGLFDLAAQYGLDESFCPVRAMLGAYVNQEHFPRPEISICSTGAVCDDFSAIAQQLEHLGFPIHWWEIPHRRTPSLHETAVRLPGGFEAPASQVAFVRSELNNVRDLLEETTQTPLTDTVLSEGIQKANCFRRTLARIRELAYTAPTAPMGDLEMMIIEMLALHFCSDYEQALNVLKQLLKEIQQRVNHSVGVSDKDAARLFWINPVADLRAMNLIAECGGRICGTDYLFTHALDTVPEDVEPMEALARTALVDPMVGSTLDRARRIGKDIECFGAEGVVVSRIPGASHCACEGTIIAGYLRKHLNLPVIEIEVPSLCDAIAPTIQTRLEALIETIKQRRKK